MFYVSTLHMSPFHPSRPGSQCRDVAEGILPTCQVWADGFSGSDTLCDMELFFCCSQVQIKAAKQRVVMASLYLGTGVLEQELVSVEGFGKARKGGTWHFWFRSGTEPASGDS